MARTKTRTRTVIKRVRSGGRKGLGTARGLFKSASEGIGGGEVAGTIARMVMPQAEPVARLGGAWIAGGTKGIIASVAFDALAGRQSILSGIIGGMSGGSGGNGGGSAV